MRIWTKHPSATKLFRDGRTIFATTANVACIGYHMLSFSKYLQSTSVTPDLPEEPTAQNSARHNILGREQLGVNSIEFHSLRRIKRRYGS